MLSVPQPRERSESDPMEMETEGGMGRSHRPGPEPVSLRTLPTVPPDLGAMRHHPWK